MILNQVSCNRAILLQGSNPIPEPLVKLTIKAK
jgi:hypothetical protein